MSNELLLESFFNYIYAREIASKMHCMFRIKCFGCQNACLSQLKHDCLVLTKKQQLEMYLDDILCMIEKENVLREWETAISTLDILPDEKQCFERKVYSECYHKSETWKFKILQMTINVVVLDRRLKLN